MNPFPPHDLLTGWLPAGTGLDDLIAAAAALATLMTVLALWQALRPNTAFERRLALVVERREAMRREAVSARTHRQSVRPVGLMRAAVTRLNLLRSQHANEAPCCSPAPGGAHPTR